MVLDEPDTRTRRRTARHRRRTDEQTLLLVPDTGGESIPLPEPTVVGRDPRNISAYPQAQRASIFDPSRSVSKTHALLVPVPGGVWVTDLHSTNGTRIDPWRGGAGGRVRGVGAAMPNPLRGAGTGRGGAAHSTGTRPRQIGGIMRKHPGAQRR